MAPPESERAKATITPRRSVEARTQGHERALSPPGEPVTCPEEGIPILRGVARSLAHESWAREELFSEGLVLLVLAEYPCSRSRLRTQLTWRLIDYVRSVRGRQRHARRAAPVSLDRDDPEGRSLHEGIADPDDQIGNLLSALSIEDIAERTRDIHRAAPDMVRGYADGTPMRVVAAAHGLSESRLSQLAHRVRARVIDLLVG